MICYNILGLIMNDADIEKFDNAQEIVSIFVNYLKQADQNSFGISDGGELTDLLKTLKNEFIKQNGLELLMKFAGKHRELYLEDGENEEDEDEFKKFMAGEKKITHERQQFALECFWSMSFNSEAAQLLKNNEKFMRHIKTLLEPQSETPPGLKKAADGVLWKLERENEFKKQQQRPQKEEFDLIISYNWDDM
ncbi:unnamed protein product [Didymodactylos carnosus]|nr:unnamed protein product [Didymodactylos carnosus]CAF4189243.1 unnamed protein product [Didymodactylos carnosus]